MPEIGPLFLCNYCKNKEGEAGCSLVTKGVITAKERKKYIAFACPYFIPTEEWKREYGDQTPEEVKKGMFERIMGEMAKSIKK